MFEDIWEMDDGMGEGRKKTGMADIVLRTISGVVYESRSGVRRRKRNSLGGDIKSMGI